MTLPASGTLGLGNDGNSNTIGYELRSFYGVGSTIGLADYYPETLVGQSTNQGVNMGQFYGRSYGISVPYSYYYNYGERGQFGSEESITAINNWYINGYLVYYIASTTYNNNYAYSSLVVNGYPGRYFFNNLYGYDGVAYTPGGVSGGTIYSYGQSGGYSYYNWYRTGNNNGGLLYAPPYGNGSGSQVFRYN
jgi:hypothetical protein